MCLNHGLAAPYGMPGRVLALTNPIGAVWSRDEADVGRRERTNNSEAVEEF
jgi:hypothetical protein